MLQGNNDIGTIKNEVLCEIAKLAFADELEQKKDSLPFEMIPGPQANFRCCIYKEREIIRQRILLAQGKALSGNADNENIIQVITSACEECPITRFVVTDNCQKCVGKRCQTACNFKAITMLRDRAYIDPVSCKECGKCAEACPYNAIADLTRPCKKSCPADAITMDEYGIVEIHKEKCIHCGNCIANCPFGAISDRSFLVDVIAEIKSDSPVYAILAPAIEGQFGPNASIGIIADGLRELGFTDVYEAALGADLVASLEALEWAEAYKEGKKMTTSCCPAFVSLIKKHFPELVRHVSSAVSPMQAAAKLIKTIHPNAVTVFIGPCIAKKNEVIENKKDNGADYALTFDELDALLRAKNIELTTFGQNLQQASRYAKNFAVSGGVTAAVFEVLKEKGIDFPDLLVKGCSGAAECKKALMLLKAGKLPEDFIEGMSCEGGCINGPGSILTGRQAQMNRNTILKNADNRTINSTLEAYRTYEISLHSGTNLSNSK